ncbi:Protein N-acetyltransferase, RimJ/RimL family [Streptoalloteichus tenebrarius]|uniref:Protein N-acetyltransferase, RimJ/RimL family n=1 Tax=Streptoalloteichus tenebrarius (strain ATCC 17920 / DSM 40477 / JCM 4838 / CBS 697.72 / NBRC 16177 / NCIMB 11028 / NRRL B-12390 / A12253. 1 / ISP 5477) TaxID=1933 RepID=A0ABT1I3J7_STRSD|nr:GNAT family N-acetyltransferase [Streptoalloteichus tenebrarius]MCP2262363.1 Protein N-acetyltransferase, RimJ/RimL family [Streptoalloteichus tenebrarius]BFF00636.1 GNAT family N-acetyltransferase [Streptoalloteichus tenebrarius]
MEDLFALGPQGLSDGEIRVRHLAEGDAEAYAAATEDPAVVRFAHLPRPSYTPELVREDIRTTIAEGLRNGMFAVLAIADATSDAYLGSIVLFDVDRAAASAEVGFLLTPTARGRGVAVRALDLVTTWCFDRLGLTELRARTEVANTASQRTLERAGFQRDGGPTTSVAPSGRTTESLHYHRRATDRRSG